MDFTHCVGQHCPLKETCLRYTSEIFGRQDFFTRPPYDTNKTKCKFYWDERPSEQAIQALAYQLWQAEGCPVDKALSYWLAAKQQLIIRRRRCR